MAGRISSATEKALELISSGKENPYSAAKRCGIDPSTIYRALARIRKSAKKKPRA